MLQSCRDRLRAESPMTWWRRSWWREVRERGTALAEALLLARRLVEQDVDDADAVARLRTVGGRSAGASRRRPGDGQERRRRLSRITPVPVAVCRRWRTSSRTDPRGGGGGGAAAATVGAALRRVLPPACRAGAGACGRGGTGAARPGKLHPRFVVP